MNLHIKHDKINFLEMGHTFKAIVLNTKNKMIGSFWKLQFKVSLKKFM